MDQLGKIKQARDQRLRQVGDDKRHEELISQSLQTQETILRAFSSFVEYLDKRVGKTQVVNQLKTIGTPDALKVVQSIEELHETVKSQERVDLTDTINALTEVLNKETQEPTDYTDKLNELLEAVKAHQTTVEAPVVNVEAPIVNVDTESVTSAVNELRDSNLRVTHTNVLIDEKFDEWRLVMKDDEPIGIQYFLNGKKVAELKYKVSDGNIVGAKKVAV
jgi:hypothetical protein